MLFQIPSISLTSIGNYTGSPLENLPDIMKEAQRELEELDSKHPTAHEHVLEESTLEDIWKPYRGYGEDCYLYSYLIGIEKHLL